MTSHPSTPAVATTIAGVMRRPGVARTVVSSILARLAFGALTLLIVLRTTEVGFSYAEAGLAAAAFTVGLGISGPMLSRVIDRTGQTTVLTGCAVAGGAAIASIGLLPESAPLPAFAAAAGAAGFTQPPLSGAMRALWDVLVAHDQERHIGYSIEAISIEVVFTGAPLVLVGVIATLTDAHTALLVAAALTCAGTLLFASSAASRQWRPSTLANEHAGATGALRARGVQTLMIVSLGAGMSFGAIEIGVTAAGRADGREALIGVLLAVWSIGSLVGGVAIARVGAASMPARRIGLLLFYWGATAALTGAASKEPLVLGALLALSGLAIAPTFATANGAMGDAAPVGRLTEAFAWTMTAMMAGITIGTPLAGALVDAFGPDAGLASGGIGPVLACCVVWLRRATLPRSAARPSGRAAAD